jgi:hypothetical protein
VAAGLAYLEAQNYVHRGECWHNCALCDRHFAVAHCVICYPLNWCGVVDLAARNVLVGENNICKVWQLLQTTTVVNSDYVVNYCCEQCQLLLHYPLALSP